MEPKDFKHKTPIQVRYKDADMQGHVNNANHVTYLEIARTAYFRDVFKENDWKKTGLILARTEIDYFEPIFFEDEVFCYTKITSFGNKSFEITNIITKSGDKSEIICAKGKSVLVCFNYELNQTAAIPDAWKEGVDGYEK